MYGVLLVFDKHGVLLVKESEMFGVVFYVILFHHRFLFELS